MITSPSLPLVLEPDIFAPQLDASDVLIVDLCHPRNWQQLHVPGAVHLDPVSLLGNDPLQPGKLPSMQRLSTLFSSLAYDPDQHIVVYDDEGGGWAGRFIWMLDAIGHTRYSYLNGGLLAWYKEGHPHEQGIRQVEPRPVSLGSGQQECTASLEDVMNAVDDPAIALWDARSAAEYAGLRSGSTRAGHIPGAFNLDWEALRDPQRNLRLHPAEQLAGLLASHGLLPGQHIITYCQSHHRSGLSYLVARALGYRIQAYAGAWAEWGNLPHTAIAQVA